MTKYIMIPVDSILSIEVEKEILDVGYRADGYMCRKPMLQSVTVHAMPDYWKELTVDDPSQLPEFTGV